MKKYIIIAVCLIVAIGSYFAYTINKNKTVKNESVDHMMMGHGSTDSQDKFGYKVELTSSDQGIQPGQTTKLTYKIVNKDGDVLKDYTVAHEKIMHLIIVRKDLQEFQHLHPEFNKSTGEFSVDVTFPTDGSYRIFPDFTPTPDNKQKTTVTLNKDINVGDMQKYKPQSVAVDAVTEKLVEGFTVSYLLPDSIKAKSAFDYSLVVDKGGELVNLESYLGAMGHGVIIKEGTLDFIHTHADGMGMGMMEMHGMSAEEHAGHQGEPNTIDFSTTLPSSGNYKVFTQFQVDGKVITTDYSIKAE